MNPRDYEDYQKSNVKASKSQLKEYIQIYAEMAKKLKSDDAIELEAVKNNIKQTYPTEIYFTLVDEVDNPVKLTLTESSKEYIIPVFTDTPIFSVIIRKCFPMCVHPLPRIHDPLLSEEDP